MKYVAKSVLLLKYLVDMPCSIFAALYIYSIFVTLRKNINKDERRTRKSESCITR